jgi:predicted transcriptional regulator
MECAMSASVSLSFRVDEQTVAQLDQLAEATDRQRSWILEQALHAYLKHHAWQVEDIRQALAEADAGDFATDEEMAETFASFDQPLN